MIQIKIMTGLKSPYGNIKSAIRSETSTKKWGKKKNIKNEILTFHFLKKKQKETNGLKLKHVPRCTLCSNKTFYIFSSKNSKHFFIIF